MKQRDCECDSCVDACKTTPGWFAPGEAERAAEHLNIPFDKFRDDYLVLDYWVGVTEPDTFVYTPRKEFNETQENPIRGRFGDLPPKGFHKVSFSYGFKAGICVFLKNNRCSIHPVKPMECRRAIPCEGTDSTRQEIAERWESAGNPLSGVLQ